MGEASVAYIRYTEFIRIVLTFQGYVLDKYFDTGLTVSFPLVVLHSVLDDKEGIEFLCPSLGACAQCHVYSRGMISDVNAYISEYAGWLVAKFALRTKRLISIDPYDGTMNWRKYIDGVFSALMEEAKKI